MGRTLTTRWIGCLLGGLLVAGLAPSGLSAQAADTSPERGWHPGRCTDGRGVTVVVDFRKLDRRTVIRCVTRGVDDGFTGKQALAAADISVRTVSGPPAGASFACRLLGQPGPRRDLNPGPGVYREDCSGGYPPTSAYWSYWSARDGAAWRYNTTAFTNHEVVRGGFEGWSFHLGSGQAKAPRPDPDRPGRESDTLTVTTGREWVLRGGTVSVRLRGLAPGVSATVRLGDRTIARDVRGDDAGRARVRADVPRALPTGRARLGVETSTGDHAATAVRITRPARLGVSARVDPARPGGRQLLRIAGLEPREPYRLRAGGRTWSTAGATAGRQGRATVALQVPRDWHGRVTARVVGAVAARHGQTRFGVRPTADQQPAASAARGVAWLIRELRHGRLPGPVGGTDWGLTADALFALHAAGVGRDAARTVASSLAHHVDDYIGPHLYDDPRARLAGPTAKTLLAAVVAGRDPHDFGGSDMRREVLALLQGPHDDQPGRISDRRTDSDSSNTFSQAIGVIGLVRSGGVPRPAVRFLLEQQCRAGWFRMFTDDRRGCDRGRVHGTASPDVDGTAMAVQAMIAARRAGVGGLDRPVERALAWLVREQRGDGSFVGGSATTGANANSTGLAAQALAAGGRSGPAGRAARWLRSVQLNAVRVRGTPAAGEQGAVGYDRAAVRTARGDGLTSTARDQWRRSTAQAVLGLARVSFGGLGDGPLGADPDPPVGDPGTGGGGGTGTPPGSGGPNGDGGSPGAGTGGSGGGDGGGAGTGSGSGPRDDSPLAGVDGRAARALAGYLLEALAGDHVEVVRAGDRYVDYAASVDVAVALQQLGAATGERRAIGDFVLSPGAVRAYVRGAPYERSGAFYADAAADLVLLSALQGRELTGRVGALTDALAETLDADGWARSSGRHAGAEGSVATQAAVLLALTAAGRADDADAAAGALLSARCDDGSFPVTAGIDGCTAGDVASTGLAVQALAAARPVAAAATVAVSEDRSPALDEAATILLATRGDDGVWRNSDNDVDVVATGAAEAGLRTVDAGSVDAAASLVALQRADGGFAALGPDDRGSNLAASTAAAPVLAAVSTVTMSGSGLAAGWSVSTAAAPATTTTVPAVDDPTDPTTSAVTSGWPAGWPRGVLPALIALLVLAAALVAHRWSRRPSRAPA